jgi:hypothetical protein
VGRFDSRRWWTVLPLIPFTTPPNRGLRTSAFFRGTAKGRVRAQCHREGIFIRSRCLLGCRGFLQCAHYEESGEGYRIIDDIYSLAFHDTITRTGYLGATTFPMEAGKTGNDTIACSHSLGRFAGANPDRSPGFLQPPFQVSEVSTDIGRAFGVEIGLGGVNRRFSTDSPPCSTS